jgi:Rieske 2Fe-2S family protein
VTFAEAAEWALPAEAYWSADWYAREQEQLFRRVWTFVGMVDDLRAGGTLVAGVGGRPSTITSQNGKLASSLGAVASWRGLVFAHREAEPEPLEAWLSDVPAGVGPFEPDRLIEVARHSFELRANWKFFVENHVDVYHLWYLHADSLGVYDHRRARWSSTGPHWVFYEPPRAEVDTESTDFWRGLRPIRHVDRDQWGSGAHLIFPNLTFATGAGFFMTYQCTPIGPDETVIDMRVRAERGSDASAMLDLSRQIVAREDGRACEAMQAAVRSPWFRVGALARDHELPITRFHRAVLGYLA